MFTGIVTDLGEVRSVAEQANNLRRLTIFTNYPRAELVEGASIACSGVCLTVTGTGEDDGRVWFAADAADETLRVTNAGRWQPGTRINLERAQFDQAINGGGAEPLLKHSLGLIRRDVEHLEDAEQRIRDMLPLSLVLSAVRALLLARQLTHLRAAFQQPLLLAEQHEDEAGSNTGHGAQFLPFIGFLLALEPGVPGLLRFGVQGDGVDKRAR